MLKASIDIGSNSVLLLIRSDDMVLEDLANVTALGKGLDKSGLFSKESMEETLKVLKSYSDTVKMHQLDPAKVIVTATEASRVAGNAKSFFEKVKLETGFNIQIITGEQEAYFSTKGVLSSGYDYNLVTIMDIGGASTELIKARVKPFEILECISIPVGAVRVNDSDNKIDYIRNKLDAFNLSIFESTQLIATAGTMTSLAAMMLGLSEYDDKKVHDSSFNMKEFDILEKEIRKSSLDELDQKFPFLGKRRFTIESGYMIAREITRVLKFDDFIVSSRGLRYGTIDMEQS